jgi:hypothetical protein
MTHPLLYVDDEDIRLDRRSVSVFGVAVLTKTPYIPVVSNGFIMKAPKLESNGLVARKEH